MIEMVELGIYKVDNGWKPGHLNYLEERMRASCPNAGIKAKPHIESRFKTLRKDWTIVQDILTRYAMVQVVLDTTQKNIWSRPLTMCRMNMSSIFRMHPNGTTSSSRGTKNVALSLEMIGRPVKRRGLLTIWWLRQLKWLRVDLIQLEWATCPSNNPRAQRGHSLMFLK